MTLSYQETINRYTGLDRHDLILFIKQAGALMGQAQLKLEPFQFIQDLLHQIY